MINSNHSKISFDDILRQVRNRIDSFSDHEQVKLKESLDHGACIINSKKQLDIYLHEYGDIHRKKLVKGYELLPDMLWSEDSISVIDYGCGQSVAEMVLADFLHSKGISSDFVESITLIEPSQVSLARGVAYCQMFFPQSECSTFCSKIENFNFTKHLQQKNTNLHIFSNVIDLQDVDYELLANELTDYSKGNNIILCVSPFYQENSRAKRMDNFGRMLKGYSLYSKLEKHIDDWNESFSCQIHVYTNILQ